VRTNFRMPDVLSVGLGGGSLVGGGPGAPEIGPRSVGYRITEEALVSAATPSPPPTSPSRAASATSATARV